MKLNNRELGENYHFYGCYHFRGADGARHTGLNLQGDSSANLIKVGDDFFNRLQWKMGVNIAAAHKYRYLVLCVGGGVYS